MKTIKKAIKKLNTSFNGYCARAVFCPSKDQRLLMFLLGTGLILVAGSDSAFAGSGGYNQACGKLLGLIEGSFGALVAAAAGVSAIIASALGGFKMAWSLVVVSIGSFVLRAYITLFNGACTQF